MSAWDVAKPLVDEAIDQDPHLPPRGFDAFLYPAALPLSRQTLTYTAGVIRRHRAQISSPWRKLTCGQQALLVLVSGPLPGAVHDLTAARIWGILRELAASRLVVLADKGYHGTGRRQGNRLDCKPARSGREPQGRRTGLHAV